MERLEELGAFCAAVGLGVGLHFGVEAAISHYRKRAASAVVPVTERPTVSFWDRVRLASEYVEERLEGFEPEVGLILGSGLGYLADDIMEPRIEIPFEDVPYFPTSTFKDDQHVKVMFVAGHLAGRRVITATYRIHYYEGYYMRDISFPIRVMIEAGIRNLLLTNATGFINPTFSIGDVMLIEDHVNFTHHNPLRGFNDPSFGPQFPDCSDIYDSELNRRIFTMAISSETEISRKFHKGVYWMSLGPTFETPSEVYVAREGGADVLGMSTVPEALCARHAGVKVTGLSLCCNPAASASGEALSDSEVRDASVDARGYLGPFVLEVIKILKNEGYVKWSEREKEEEAGVVGEVVVEEPEEEEEGEKSSVLVTLADSQMDSD